MTTFTKDSAEKLDYTIDWSSWLTGSDTIANAPAWTVPAGLVLDSSSYDTSRATAWLRGGTPGVDYLVECRITTAQGRIAERAITIRCVESR